MVFDEVLVRGIVIAILVGIVMYIDSKSHYYKGRSEGWEAGFKEAEAIYRKIYTPVEPEKPENRVKDTVPDEIFMAHGATAFKDTNEVYPGSHEEWEQMIAKHIRGEE